MTVTTRSAESTATSKITTSLLSIDAQTEALTQEEQSEIARIRSEYIAKRLALAEEKQKLEAEEAERRRQAEEEQKKKLEAEKNSSTTDDNNSSAVTLVKMTGAAVCLRCRNKGLECLRAPRQKFFQPMLDNTPGILKDFVRCKACADARGRCRTDVPEPPTPSASVSAPAPAFASCPVAAQRTMSESRGSTSSATVVSEPINRDARVSAGAKRKRVIAPGSDSEYQEEADEDDEEEEYEDEETYDSRGVPIKRRRTDKTHRPHPKSTATRSAPGTIKKPNYSSSRYKSTSQRIYSRASSARVVEEDEEGNSEPEGLKSKATASIQQNNALLQKLIDTVERLIVNDNRNHQASMEQNQRNYDAIVELVAQNREQTVQLLQQATGGGLGTSRLATPGYSSYTRGASSSSAWGANGSAGGASRADGSTRGSFGETRREDGERKEKGKGKERMCLMKAEPDQDDEFKVEGIIYSPRQWFNNDEQEEADELVSDSEVEVITIDDTDD